MWLEYQIYVKDRTGRERSRVGGECFRPDGLILPKSPDPYAFKDSPISQDNLVIAAPMTQGSTGDCSSRLLHKYAKEVLAMPIEHNEPQNGRGDCQTNAGWIQEQVIQENVHDYWSKQYQRKGHEPIHQQQRATQDLECRHDKKVMRLEE